MENVGTLRVIVPAMLAYGTLGVVGWSFFPRLFIALREGDSVEYNMVLQVGLYFPFLAHTLYKGLRLLLQILYFIPALGAFATPLAFFVTYPPLKRALFSDARRMFCQRPYSLDSSMKSKWSMAPEKEAEIYFTQLNASWK